MSGISRRSFIAAATAGTAVSVVAQDRSINQRQARTETARSADVEVLLPRDRVPLSFVIDDSTCLVNMGHFCNPQFAEAWPDRAEYKKPWRDWPREIPDSFVREFGEWCAEHDVKGKYSIVPYPACVGWLDRELPGWSRKELQASLQLVRDVMVPNWDIHPEMITHTRVIDLKTGRPLEEISKATMENSFPQEKKSVDEMASYLAYALRILKNCGFPCEGITTPGGFGNMVKQELPQAVFESVRDVFGSELPHYFKYVETGDRSTTPRLETGQGNHLQAGSLTVNVPAGTGDWFGGWQGINRVERDRYLSLDGQSGRMADLIHRKEPAVMLCHWPGMFNNGTKEGFKAFQSIVTTLKNVHGDDTIWMKLSEIGRYWAAKETAKFVRHGDELLIDSAYACRSFTLKIPPSKTTRMEFQHGATRTGLRRVYDRSQLQPATYTIDGESNGRVLCIDLPKGTSKIKL